MNILLLQQNNSIEKFLQQYQCNIHTLVVGNDIVADVETAKKMVYNHGINIFINALPHNIQNKYADIAKTVFELSIPIIYVQNKLLPNQPFFHLYEDENINTLLQQTSEIMHKKLNIATNLPSLNHHWHVPSEFIETIYCIHENVDSDQNITADIKNNIRHITLSQLAQIIKKIDVFFMHDSGQNLNDKIFNYAIQKGKKTLIKARGLPEPKPIITTYGLAELQQMLSVLHVSLKPYNK